MIGRDRGYAVAVGNLDTVSPDGEIAIGMGNINQDGSAGGQVVVITGATVEASRQRPALRRQPDHPGAGRHRRARLRGQLRRPGRHRRLSTARAPWTWRSARALSNIVYVRLNIDLIRPGHPGGYRWSGRCRPLRAAMVAATSATARRAGGRRRSGHGRFRQGQRRPGLDHRGRRRLTTAARAGRCPAPRVSSTSAARWRSASSAASTRRPVGGRPQRSVHLPARRSRTPTSASSPLAVDDAGPADRPSPARPRPPGCAPGAGRRAPGISTTTSRPSSKR